MQKRHQKNEKNHFIKKQFFFFFFYCLPTFLHASPFLKTRDAVSGLNFSFLCNRTNRKQKEELSLFVDLARISSPFFLL